MRMVTTLLLLFGTLLAAGPAGAAETKMRFEPIGVYELELDGKVVSDVKMYHSPEAAAVMVITPRLPYPIAIVPRNKTIQRLDPAELKDEPLGSVLWTPAATPKAVGTFELVEEKPIFELDGKKIRFLDKKPLLGPVTEQQIFAYDPSYAYRAATADPPTTYLPVIESWPQNVLVKIYFSSECQVCRELLPGIFKTIDLIKNPKFKFEFYGMPLPATKDPLGVELKISDFPTGILYVDGKEVARATGHSWKMPDMAIHNALQGIQVDPEALRVQPGAAPAGGPKNGPNKPSAAPTARP
jgi:thiol-disulfide isomerase/thioredoxin